MVLTPNGQFLGCANTAFSEHYELSMHQILPKSSNAISYNLLKPNVYVMHQQFNIQQLYVLPTLYCCVLYSSKNKQRLVPLTS